MSRLPESSDTLDSLPINTVDAGSRYYRVNSIGHPTSVFYSRSRQNRWTPLAGSVGVCYMAEMEVGALAESVCRNAAQLRVAEKFTSIDELHRLGMYGLQVQGSVDVLDLTVPNLSKYRLDAGILADYDKSAWPPYRFCPAWATRAVDLGLGGVLYRSRHHVDQLCLALFGLDVLVDEVRLGTLDENHYLGILEDEFDWAIV